MHFHLANQAIFSRLLPFLVNYHHQLQVVQHYLHSLTRFPLQLDLLLVPHHFLLGNRLLPGSFLAPQNYPRAPRSFLAPHSSPPG
jgi:hypothetical protein